MKKINFLLFLFLFSLKNVYGNVLPASDFLPHNRMVQSLSGCNSIFVSGFSTDGSVDEKSLAEAIRSSDNFVCLKVYFDDELFYLNNPIIINRGNISIVGNKTKLLISPEHIKRYYDNLSINPSWEGGYLSFINDSKNLRLSVESPRAKRYSKRISLSDTSEFSVGDNIEITWFTNGKKNELLMKHIFGFESNSNYGSRVESDQSIKVLSQKVKVISVNYDHIIIDRKLLHDIDPVWDVRFFLNEYSERILVHGLDFVFPNTSYNGHLMEDGLNSLYFDGVKNVLISDISSTNADSAILIHGSSDVFATDLYLNGRLGHYGFAAFDSNSIFFSNFFVNSLLKHSISANTGCQLCVFNNGTIVRGRADLHRGYNTHSFFNNITIISSYDPLTHGGSVKWGPANGINTIFNNFKVLTHSNFSCKDCFDVNFINLYRGNKLDNELLPLFSGYYY